MPTMLISKAEAKRVALSLSPEVRQDALRLRQQGYSNYDISEKLNLPYPHVVAEVLRHALLQGFADPRKYQRQLEEARLEMLFQDAYSAFRAVGSVDWFDRALKTSERKSKLLGLDAPVEQVVTTTNTGDAGVTAALKAIAGRLPV